MALINTLRQKMGKIVVVLVAFSMVAFIGTDLIQGNSALFGQNNEIGEINGTAIDYQDFTERVDLISYNYSLNTGRNPSSTELEQIRQQAWQELIVENVFQPQFEKAGIDVTNAEIVDMVQGNNINPQIRQYFTDPNTGQFDKNNVINFLRNLSQATPQQRQSWIAFESTLGPTRQLTKYENLLEKTKFANKFEAKAQYKSSATANVEFFYVPFTSVSDTLFDVTDGELRSYLNENSEQYQRDETKDLSFISYDIVPSADDTLDIMREMESLKEGLMNAQDDSVFANINSEGFMPYSTYTNLGEVPEQLKVDGILVEEGTVTDPFVRGDFMTIHKLSQSGEGDEYFLKASHILFSIDDENSESEARRVLNELKGGADFVSMASTYGTDGTASRGGDLGWFGENSNFVQEFKDAAFGFSGTGLLPNIVETQFGYHIIKITEPKTNIIYKVATVEREIYASDLTLNEIYRQADQFAVAATSVESFIQEAQARGLEVRKASNVNKNSKRVANLPEARNIVFWLFNKANEDGDVSDVFELDDKYVVAVQTGYQEEGTAELNDVRNEITRKVIDQKKAEYIKEKIAGLSGTYSEKAMEYGVGARNGSTELDLNSNSFGDLGFAPEAVGVAFSLEQGESTLPFEMPNGIIEFTLTSKEVPSDVESYEAYRSIVLNNQRSFRRNTNPFTFQNIYNALTENAEIEDNRYKFF